MTPEELDAILNSDEAPEPSPAFVRNVMASVRREPGEPAPLRFPWWRFGAGVVASGAMAAGGTALLAQSGALSAPTPDVAAAAVYAIAMLLISVGVVALPRVSGRL